MGSRQQNESKPSPQDGQESDQQAQQRSDAHTNSARAGENPNQDDDVSDAGVHKRQLGQQSRTGK